MSLARLVGAHRGSGSSGPLFIMMPGVRTATRASRGVGVHEKSLLRRIESKFVWPLKVSHGGRNELNALIAMELVD